MGNWDGEWVGSISKRTVSTEAMKGKEHGTVSKLNGVEGEQGRMRVDGVGLVWVPENQIWRQGLGSGCLIRR